MTAKRQRARLRYLLSLLFPVPMSSTYLTHIDGERVQRGECGNHFESEQHTDMVSARWWQWRGRTWRKRTVTFCVPARPFA